MVHASFDKSWRPVQVRCALDRISFPSQTQNTAMSHADVEQVNAEMEWCQKAYRHFRLKSLITLYTYKPIRRAGA